MALSALRLVPAARRNLDDREYRLIAGARDAGTTWREIAEALGLQSPQAAAQRYNRLAERVSLASR